MARPLHPAVGQALAALKPGEITLVILGGGIVEHRQVTLTVTAEDRPSSLSDLSGRISADDAEEMRTIVEGEFERVDLREWP